MDNNDEAKKSQTSILANSTRIKVEENTFIEAPLEVEKIRKEPYSLPEPFSWSEVDLLSNDQLDELYTLLNENYVEDDENMFRFDYGRDFLKWALTPSGWKNYWHCGVRAAGSKLLAFIAANSCSYTIYDKTIQMVEINFLCVHKKLRSKSGIFQATFTAGIIIPKPVGSCRYWHRSLNPKKLIETKFSHLGKNMTLHRTIKLYRLPENTHYPLKPLAKEYIQSAFDLLTNYLTKFEYLSNFQSGGI
uniref:Glycylpeptide N-tetradecanoyltransferase n=1 Tax=Meloidogyne enterolobii TaxID=390850 RepID=A0A6V7XJ90_MELEN|nr:unnamed protein product [Meloidogyne enterolobii]